MAFKPYCNQCQTWHTDTEGHIMSLTNIYSGAQKDRNGDACIWLQGVGLFNAKPAEQLEIGDRMVWNYGHASTVLSVRHHKNSVFVTERDDTGKEWPERRFNKSRLIAVAR